MRVALNRLVGALAPLLIIPGITCRNPAGRELPKLRVTAIPDANKDSLREDQDRIVGWLSMRLGVTVVFLPVENYAAAVTALVHGQADMGWLGGVTTVQAFEESGGKIRPIVTRESDLHFRSHIIVRSDLPASSLRELRGRSFSFGSKSSTSGHVMPRHFLQEQGLVPERHFSRVAYSGDHNKTVLDVASGAVDAGAVNYKYFERMVTQKQVDPSRVRILWTTPDFVDYAWVVREDLDETLGEGAKKKIAAAFLSLDPAREEDRKILAVQQAERYVEARMEMWDALRAIVRDLDVTP